MAILTLELAERAAKAAQAKARELNVNMSVVVLDEGGNLVLAARADGTGFLTVEVARGKAYAAVAMRRATRVIAEGFGQNPAFWGSLVALNGGRIIAGAGGVPIAVGGQVVGSIGCSGGTGEQDNICAEAGAGAVA